MKTEVVLKLNKEIPVVSGGFGLMKTEVVLK